MSQSRVISAVGAVALMTVLLLTGCEELSPLGRIIEGRLQLPPPTMSYPAADAVGYWSTDVEITLESDDPDARIYYSIDRSDPTGGGTLYKGPFFIGSHNDPIQVKAVTRKTDHLDSPVVQAEFLMIYDSVAQPTFNQAADADGTVSVRIQSATSGAEIWYTTDGTDPTVSATRKVYGGTPITISDDGSPSGSQVLINAYCRLDGLPDSPIISHEVTVLYDILTMPSISPVSTNSKDPFSVSLSAGDDEAIWYTTDGSSPVAENGMNPASNARLYRAPIDVTWNGYESRLIKAAAFAPGYRPSPVQIGAYFKLSGRTPAPEVEYFDADGIKPVYDRAARMATAANHPGFRIKNPVSGTRYFYTLNGLMPMVEINGYEISILNPDDTFEITGNANLVESEGSYELMVLAVTPGLDPSPLYAKDYLIDRTPPDPAEITLSGFYTGPGEGGGTDEYLNRSRTLSGGWEISVADDGSGWGGFEFSTDGTDWQSMVSNRIDHGNIGLYNPDFIGTDFDGANYTQDGRYEFYFRYADEAGNWAPTAAREIVRDITPPKRYFPGAMPSDGSFGQWLSMENKATVSFSEDIQVSTLTFTLSDMDDGGTVISDSFTGPIYDDYFKLSSPSMRLELDHLYKISITYPVDLAGNPTMRYTDGTWISEQAYTSWFKTGAIFWSQGPNIYRAPISPHGVWVPAPDFNPGNAWYTGDPNTVITDVETIRGKIFWSCYNPVTDTSMIYRHIAKNENGFSNRLEVLQSKTSGRIEDIEVTYQENDIGNAQDDEFTVYFTTNQSPWRVWKGVINAYFMTPTLAPPFVPTMEASVGRETGGLAESLDKVYWCDDDFILFMSSTNSISPASPPVTRSSMAMETVQINGNYEFYSIAMYDVSGEKQTYKLKRIVNGSFTGAGAESYRSISALGDHLLSEDTYDADLEKAVIDGETVLFSIAPVRGWDTSLGAYREYSAIWLHERDMVNSRLQYGLRHDDPADDFTAGAIAIDDF